jgi:hypothetical protein
VAFGREAEAEGFVNSVECLYEAAFKLNDCIRMHNCVNWVIGDHHCTLCCDISSLALVGLFSFDIIVIGECYGNLLLPQISLSRHSRILTFSSY